MRFSANENFPSIVVAALRSAGHDVFWVHADMRGASDEAVLAHAIFEKRVLVTFDKDFGELVYRVGLPADSGIIVFRIPTKSPADVAERILKVIDSRDDWAGIFAVVTNDRIGSGFGSFRIDRDGHSGGEAEGPSVDAEEVRGEGKR